MSFPKAIVFTTLGKHAGSVMNTIQMAEVEDCFSDGGGPKKRRRLTHLSPDEKIMRRKLKNRVAAQTARDRKKVQMQELEEKVAKLEEEKKLLLKEYTQLQASTQTLQQENDILKKQLTTYTVAFAKVAAAPSEMPSNQTPNDTESSHVANTALSCKTEPVSPRSAAPAVSLPKEQIQVLSRVMMQYAAFAMTLSLILCFATWKNSVDKLEGSSRKRKQPRPARRPLMGLESSLLLETSPRQKPWWGPQQQNWSPSMN